MQRVLWHVFISAWLVLGCHPLAVAQEYPTKPVRLIVPFPAAGGSDVVGRILAHKLTERLGQQVVVENRAGAGGSIGTEVAVRSPPDGYTMVLAGTSEIAVNPWIYSKLTYDTVRDLVPVAMVASTPMVVVITPSLPITNITDLVKFANAKPGAVNVGSAGNGSFTHLAAEFFRSMNGLTWTHVPYKGAPPALTDLASGRVQVMFSTVPAAMSMIKSNLIKPIAVSTQARDSSLPEVPTILESGITGYDVQFWYGVFVPVGTPKEVIAKLADSIAQTVKSPDVIESLAKQGATPGAMTQAQFGDYVKSEVERWGRVVKESGAKID
jgi:tripartite-type tricarboxylate transporter receptor subunit TctC